MRYAGYWKRNNTAGSFEIGFNSEDSRVLTIEPYHLMEFWLRDLFGGVEYQNFLDSLPDYRKDPTRPGWYRDYTGLALMYPTMEQLSDGSTVSVVRGRSLNEFLYSEHINFPAGSAQADKTGPAETVGKEYVNENIGPGAGVDAAGYTRVRAGLSIEADAGSGGTYSGLNARHLVGDILQDMSELATGPSDYNIVQTGDATFEFQWKSPIWGLDKRVGNGVRRPVLFSAQMGNVENVTSKISYMESCSAAMIYGQGIGMSQKTGAAYDTTFTSLTSWARKVRMRQGRTLVEQETLDDLAYAELKANQRVIDVTCSLIEIIGCRYGTHWEVGDLITVADTVFGRQVHRKVLGAWVSLRSAQGGAVGGTVTFVPELGEYIGIGE